jgi:hypothetical protein
MWSTHLSLVGMLDMWVGPKPEVAGHVRSQLTWHEERRKIKEAIDGKLMGLDFPANPYSRWLSRTGLDFESEDPAFGEAIDGQHIEHALFDLMLGERFKLHRLQCHTEFHAARGLIEGFFTEFRDWISPTLDVKRLWWDETQIYQATSSPWVSPALREDGGFLAVFKSWLGDSDRLQTWLERLEAETPLVNNPGDAEHVFSETAAIEVLKLAKVGIATNSRIDLRLTLSFQAPGQLS